MTIILIPGLMSDAHIWSGQIAALSRIAPVHVARTDGATTLGEMADRILAATAGPIAIAGHSMGGRVALELWRKAPGRISRLALVDTGANGPADSEREGRLALVRIAETRGMAATAEAWLPPMVHPRLVPGDPIWTGLVQMIERASPETLAGQQNALLARPDAEPLLAAITVPTAFIVGDGDGPTTPDQHRAMAARVPGASVTVIEAAGHMAPLEQPAAVTAALLDWLQRRGSKPGS